MTLDEMIEAVETDPEWFSTDFTDDEMIAWLKELRDLRDQVSDIVTKCHAAAYHAYSTITPTQYAMGGPALVCKTMLQAINAVSRPAPPSRVQAVGE